MRLKPLAISIVTVLALAAAPAQAAALPAWHTAFDATENTPTNGVSCGTITFCMVVGNRVAVEDDGPIYETVAELHEPTAVSCAPASHWCMTLDSNGGSVEFSGGEFADDVVPVTGDYEFLSASCAAVNRCMAITHSFTPSGGGADRFRIYKLNDAGWDGGTELNAAGISGSSQPKVACATENSCVVVANATGGERYWTYSGSGWTFYSAAAITDRGVGDYTVSLTCTATNFCLSTSHDGEASVYTGSSWTTVTVDSHGLKQLASSCSGKTCRAITAGQYAYKTTNGTSWTADNPAKLNGLGVGAPSSMSCPSADTCVASDGSGDTTTYGLDIVPQKPPVISGVGAVGETLTISKHSVIDNANAWFFPEWWRCDHPGSTCTQIPDEHDFTYTVSDDDVGKYIDVLEGTGIGLDEELFRARSNNIAVPGPTSPPSGGTPDTGGSPSDESPGTGAGASKRAPRLGKASTSKKGVVTVTLTCPAGSARCTGALSLTFKAGKKHKAAGSGHYSVAPGKKGKAKVKLKGAARKLLRSRHKLSVVLTLKPAGAKATTRKLTLKLPKH